MSQKGDYEERTINSQGLNLILIRDHLFLCEGLVCLQPLMLAVLCNSVNDATVPSAKYANNDRKKPLNMLDLLTYDTGFKLT